MWRARARRAHGGSRRAVVRFGGEVSKSKSHTMSILHLHLASFSRAHCAALDSSKQHRTRCEGCKVETLIHSKIISFFSYSFTEREISRRFICWTFFFVKWFNTLFFHIHCFTHMLEVSNAGQSKEMWCRRLISSSFFSEPHQWLVNFFTIVALSHVFNFRDRAVLDYLMEQNFFFFAPMMLINSLFIFFGRF